MDPATSRRPFLLVTGSRTIASSGQLGDLVRAGLDEHPSRFTTLIVGDARGVDAAAAAWAADHGVEHRVFPADWAQLGNRAGYLRNVEMVRILDPAKGDTCLAFWDGSSKGTKHTIDLALKAKIDTRIVFLPAAEVEAPPRFVTGL